MKKILLLSAAAALACAACSKESVPEAPAQSDGIKVTMTATAESAADTKVSLSGTAFSWEVGDEISLRWGNTTYASTSDCETLSATSAGASATFEGTFSTYYEDENIYAYYDTDGSFKTASHVIRCKDIPTAQSGKLADIKDYLLFYSWVKKTSNSNTTIKNIYADDGTTMTGLTFTTTMSPMFAVVKLTVPEALGATSIKMSGDSYLTGRVELFPARTGTSYYPFVANGNFLYRTPNTSGNTYQYTDVTVSNEGAVLNGDIYFVVAPDAYGGDSGQSLDNSKFYCSTSSLTFTFTTAGGDITFTRPLDSKIYNGTLKDLGSVPSTLKSTVEGGTIRLLDGKELAIGIENANEDCTYYVEYGTSESDCAKPTTSSAEIDLSEGWPVPNSGTSLKYFVKVLAHSNNSNYSDAYLKAYLQAYNFSSGSPSATGLIAAVTSTDEKYISDVDTGFTTSEGLYIGRTKTGTTTVSSVDSGRAVQIQNSYVAPFVIPQYGGQAYFYLKTNTNRSYLSASEGGTRQISLLTKTNSNSGSSWESLTATAAGTNVYTYKVKDLGTISTGSNVGYGIRNDGNYPLYTLALLEVL